MKELKQIEKLVSEINDLIGIAIDSDGDALYITDPMNTMENRDVYLPIELTDNTMKVEYHDVYSPHNKTTDIYDFRPFLNDPVGLEDSEEYWRVTEALDDLKYLRRLIKKSIKQNNKPEVLDEAIDPDLRYDTNLPPAMWINDFKDLDYPYPGEDIESLYYKANDYIIESYDPDTKEYPIFNKGKSLVQLLPMKINNNILKASFFTDRLRTDEYNLKDEEEKEEAIHWLQYVIYVYENNTDSIIMDLREAELTESYDWDGEAEAFHARGGNDPQTWVDDYNISTSFQYEFTNPYDEEFKDALNEITGSTGENEFEFELEGLNVDGWEEADWKVFVWANETEDYKLFDLNIGSYNLSKEFKDFLDIEWENPDSELFVYS